MSPLTACTPQYLHENRSIRLVQQKPTFYLDSRINQSYGVEGLNREMRQLVRIEAMCRNTRLGDMQFMFSGYTKVP